MSKRLSELIKDAREKNVSKLELHLLDAEDIKNIHSIPEEIFEISSLNELHLGQLPIKEISSKIQNLKNLKKLSSYSKLLTSFPLELLKIESLNHLTLASTQIKTIPENLNDWTTLKYLNLDHCSNLDEFKGFPPRLTYLNISGVKFSSIPKVVFRSKLLKLVATSLKLSHLPKKLWDIETLVSLFIGRNQLTSISDGILSLSQLRELWIEENNFIEFPSIISSLKNLQAINLSGNYLESLPESIKELLHVNYLNLGSNNFKEIPDVLFNLQNLVELNFGNYSVLKNRPSNKIKIVPNDVLKLSKLKRFEMFQNPVENIPPEILKQGIEAIKNFLLEKLEADEEEFLYEAKMVVVGRGNVGKTVLRRKLTEPGYSLSHSNTTNGIDILKKPFMFPMPGLSKSDNFRFNIWDFGGQEKYDATHQLFITNRSIYLFLTEAREESNYLDFYHWLNTISLFGGEAPVVVVLSKYDERRKHLPESLYRERFGNIVEFVDVSCADGYEYTIENLKKAIEKSILLLPQTNQKLSNHWIDIRNALEELSKTRDFISYEEYLEVCQKYKLDQKRANFLSQYLNDLGVIIHHQHDLLLRKTVFIKTDWCVDGMYKVLDDSNVINGKFTTSDLSKIWNNEKFKNKQAELLKLMREYDLCFELKDGSGFIAPDLLPHDRPKELVWDNDQNLQFEIRYTFMPVGILSRFIVKSHSFIRDNLYWKYGVILQHETTAALIEEDYLNSKIRISLKGNNKKGLLTAVRMFIDEVHKDFDKANKLSFEEMVPCNCQECTESGLPHFYKFNVLKKFEQKLKITVPCEQSGADVKISSLVNDIQVHSPKDLILQNEDLLEYILHIIDTILAKEITMKGGYINFWRDQKCSIPKNEIEMQPYISNVIDNNCKLKGIQLSREVREANGSVDILFSYTNINGELLKICLEIKKAHHDDIETAIQSQLPLYMESAGTNCGIYLIIWTKNSSFKEPKKYQSIAELETAVLRHNSSRNILIKTINCSKKTSPSKKKKNL